MQEPPRKSPASDHSPDSALGPLSSEEFLFHMYRGSELLQEDRVHEAKEEIESALRLQPSDPKGQALLAMVYFRLGVYPRAIRIYEELINSFPEETSPRINLSLCYLKTGQPDRARSLLEEVVRVEPKHERAWGYLGLAFERLRDFERARVCFERAGQKAMARRMIDLAVSPETDGHSVRPDAKTALRLAAAEAYHELEEGEASFSVAETVTAESRREGDWQEVGGASLSGWTPPPESVSAPPSVRSPLSVSAPVSVSAPISVAAPQSLRVPQLARDTTLSFSQEWRVVVVDRSVVIRIDHGFCVRLDLIRALSSRTTGVKTETLLRRSRGKSEALPLGSSTRPLALVTEATHLVLQASGDRKLTPIQLVGDFVYVREDALGGFDQALSYENGRLPIGEGEASSLVRVHGRGFVVVDFPTGYQAIQVKSGASLMVRRSAILGWCGRLVPRALAQQEAPLELLDCVAFSGEGAVWIESVTS